MIQIYTETLVKRRGGRLQGGGSWIESLWPGWKKVPFIGGSHWEALSLQCTRPNGKRISFFISFTVDFPIARHPWCPVASLRNQKGQGMVRNWPTWSYKVTTMAIC